MRAGERQQWYFTCTVHIPDVKHKVRLVIIWRSQWLCENATFDVSAHLTRYADTTLRHRLN
jgi:hypothetical protein